MAMPVARSSWISSSLSLSLVLVACGEPAVTDSSGSSSNADDVGDDEDDDVGDQATEQGDSATSASNTSDPSDADTDADTDADESGTKFDVLAQGDAGNSNGTCVGGSICEDAEYSYIWIANSSEHTVSKLDTRTMTEAGRYRTKSDNNGNPSRTSVSVDGRAVAIANRHVGITKIWARESDCIDANDNGMIDTSTGKLDVKPFGQDECLAWFTDFPGMTVQRPVAWTSGTYNEQTCEWEDQKIWTTTGDSGTPGQCGMTGVWVHRLDGETGVVEDTIHIPHAEVPCTFGASDWGLGPYGAAVDNEGNMWWFVFGQSKFVRVDFDTLEYTIRPGGSYGITVDSEGRPWNDVPQRLNLLSNQWESPIGNLPGAGGSGVAQDLQGRIWKSTPGGVGWVDMETMVVGDIVPLPGGNVNYRGISVDVDGFIWAIPLGGTAAYKIDPDTYEIDFYEGLNGPYSYSDMSGGQISNVTCNPPAG